MKILLNIFFFLFVALGTKAQNTSTVLIFTNENGLVSNVEEAGITEQIISKKINLLWDEGYLLAGIDSVVKEATKNKVYYKSGPKYLWGKINTASIKDVFWATLGLERNYFKNKVVQSQNISKLSKKILDYCEENGYPFAEVFLDSIKIINDTVYGNLKLNQNYFISMDSISIEGDVDISENYLRKYLSLPHKMPYKQSTLNQISDKIKLLSFLQETKPWVFSFGVNKSILSLYLQEKNANRADILVGLLPTNNLVTGTRNFMFTGDVKLGLINSFGFGEQFLLNWLNLQYKSPRLNIETTLPYIFGSNLGINAKFNYIKNDSSFTTINTHFGLQYLKTAKQIFKAYYELSSSRLIQVDTFAVKLNKTLPINNDVRSNVFGLEWWLNNTDYLNNPKKGYTFLINSNIGLRNILSNNTIIELRDITSGGTFKYLYDSINKNNVRYQITAKAEKYFSINKFFVTKFMHQLGVVYNKRLFRNELFQIGGFRNLRGFNEASLFVNEYFITTLEPRFILSSNSYWFAFSDIAFLRSKFIDNNRLKNGLGLGTGISLTTKGGLFNIMYAVGNNLADKILFREGKIHFGYISVF